MRRNQPATCNIEAKLCGGCSWGVGAIESRRRAPEKVKWMTVSALLFGNGVASYDVYDLDVSLLVPFLMKVHVCRKGGSLDV